MTAGSRSPFWYDCCRSTKPSITCWSETLGACDATASRQIGQQWPLAARCLLRCIVRHASQNVWPQGKSIIGRCSLPAMSS
eukprot:1264995-Prymnesium_polylepis.1